MGATEVRLRSVRPPPLRAVALIAALVGLSAACSSPEAKAFTVIVPADTLSARLPAPGSTLGQEIGNITALADRQPCATVDLIGGKDKNARGDVLIVIGRKGQPNPCRTEGAKVVFIRFMPDGYCFEFYVETTVQPGITEALTNMAPKPPQDPGPPPWPEEAGKLACLNSRVPPWPWPTATPSR